MQTKLTLRLEEKLIRRAKALAKTSGKSVSQMVADYFALLNDNDQDQEEKPPMTPIVRSLKGALRGHDVTIEEYHRYLEDKHL